MTGCLSLICLYLGATGEGPWFGGTARASSCQKYLKGEEANWGRLSAAFGLVLGKA